MMARPIPVPQDALLQRYVAQEGAYTDCFEAMHPLEVSFEEFVAAFYTTWLFRLERAVLTLSQRKRITDSDVKALAGGTADRFAVWHVEDRQKDQILLCDKSSVTRSYLALTVKDGGVTRLIFGSAVVSKPGQDMPWWVRALMPLHVFYSKALLRTAERRLRRGT